MQIYEYFITGILVGAALGFVWSWSWVRARTMGIESGYQFSAGVFGAMIGGFGGALASAVWIALMALHT